MALGPTSRAVGCLEDDEIAALPISIPDSNGSSNAGILYG